MQNFFSTNLAVFKLKNFEDYSIELVLWDAAAIIVHDEVGLNQGKAISHVVGIAIQHG